MKYYCICEDVNCNDKIYITTESKSEKGDLMVIMEYDEPELARVVDYMDELVAITSDHVWYEALAVVSVKAYYENRKKEVERAKLVKLMKEQIELQKLEDTLRKNSECNPQMASLFEKYKELCD